ncbi:hypothetical protein BD560DRAFT_413173 [Blakeslea trispora]|nr:hypothetical protein BD560DRAFT_413173 [Blakeslea trispora]
MLFKVKELSCCSGRKKKILLPHSKVLKLEIKLQNYSSFSFLILYFFFQKEKMILDIHGIAVDQALKENGFVIVDHLIPKDMFERLREACDRVVDRARKGDWKYKRLVGTQFPPWTEGTDVWGVQHLIHPDLKEPVFAEWYGSEKLLEAVQQLINVKHDELQLELFNLLINPQDSDFDLTWHRDAIKAEASEQEEAEKLSIPHYGTQWNTALYEDECLYVVPNSHRRIRTKVEREITIHDPKSNKMPGQLKVVLKPGQTHGLGWMKSDTFKSTLPPSLLQPLDNLLRMAEEAGMSDLETKPIH